jgi:hypothetical protein
MRRRARDERKAKSGRQRDRVEGALTAPGVKAG